MQNSDPPQTQCCHYNCIFAYAGYLTQTLILNVINQHSQVYLCFTNIAFLDPNSGASCASHKREVVHVLVLLRRAHGMSDKQFVYANRAVFST